jgi:hypothetical protein
MLILKAMKKSNLPNFGTIIPPIMLAGCIITPPLQQDLIEKPMLGPNETLELHWEEFPPSDSFGLIRDFRTSIVTGTNRVAVFGKDNSNEMFFR